MTKSSSKRTKLSAQTLCDSPIGKQSDSYQMPRKNSKIGRPKKSGLKMEGRTLCDNISKEPEERLYLQQSFQAQILKQVKQEDHDCSNYKIAKSSKWNKKIPSQIFFSDKFQGVEEEDLLIYFKTLNHSRTSGVILADEYGRILYSDKIGHELFQGSLNKFGTLKVQNLLLKTLRAQNLQQLKNIKSYNEKSIFNWIIYSKNNKRRYSNVPFDSNKNSPYDIYFRFLKCLSIRIRPISIKINQFSLFQGLWNYHNIQPRTHYQCFMLEIKNSNEMPSLNKEDILNDTILQKYMNSNSKKLQKLSSNRADNQSNKVFRNSFFAQDSLQKDVGLQGQKKPRQKAQNVNTKNKASQNKGIKQQQKKTSSLKQSYGVCLITQIFFDEE